MCLEDFNIAENTGCVINYTDIGSACTVCGAPRDLSEILQDPQLSRIISNEGPIPETLALLRALQ